MKIKDSPLWERVDAARGQILCCPGDRTNSLYLIRSGRVEITEPRGSRMMGPGEFFGELDFTQSGALALTVRALEDTSLLRIDGQCLTRQLRKRRSAGKLRLKKLLGCGDRLIFLC